MGAMAPDRDADDRPDPAQLALWAAMTPEKRYQIGRSLYRTAWRLKLAAVRSERPSAPETEIVAEARRQLRRA